MRKTHIQRSCQIPPAQEISSGLVVRCNFNQTKRLVSDLTNAYNKHRSCFVGVINNSGHNLRWPRRFMCSGSSDSIPLEIEPGCTGLMALLKEPKTLKGSAGVVTYALAESENRSSCCRYLQIMWSMPYVGGLFYNAWVNVSVGPETASRSLFHRMYAGNWGNLMMAKEDVRHVVYSDGFLADLSVMCGSNLELVVDLNPDKGF